MNVWLFFKSSVSYSDQFIIWFESIIVSWLALDQNTHNILIMAVAPVPIHQNSVDGISLTMPKPTMNWLEPWSVVAKQLMTTTMTP